MRQTQPLVHGEAGEGVAGAAGMAAATVGMAVDMAAAGVIMPVSTTCHLPISAQRITNMVSTKVISLHGEITTTVN